MYDRYALLGIADKAARVYTFNEAREILAVGEHTMLQLLRSGELRGFRLPDSRWGRWKISEQAIKDYVRKMDGQA